MKLTTKGRYAVTAMLDLALQDSKKATSLIEISKRQNVSLSYLEQLFAKLRRKGLVNSLRGPGGGYQLSHGASETWVADIILAVDEDLDVRNCKGKRNCNQDAQCITHHLWNELSEKINGYLTTVSLADLVKREQQK